MATHKINTDKLEKHLDEMHHRRSLLEQELIKPNLKYATHGVLTLRYRRTIDTIEKIEKVLQDIESN
mgnify:CR=1 FL=1